MPFAPDRDGRNDKTILKEREMAHPITKEATRACRQGPGDMQAGTPPLCSLVVVPRSHFNNLVCLQGRVVPRAVPRAAF